MEKLKTLFGDESITFDQFTEKLKAAEYNLVDLKDGGYVSKEKYDSAKADAKRNVDTLTEKLSTFADMDPEAVKAQIAELQTANENLQAEMAATEYAHKLDSVVAGEKFSSTAAKKMFLTELKAKDFKFDGDTLLGYKDYVSAYKESDPTAFAVEEDPAGGKKPDFVGGSGTGSSGKAVTHDEFMKMSTTDQIKFKDEQPELFKTFIK